MRVATALHILTLTTLVLLQPVLTIAAETDKPSIPDAWSSSAHSNLNSESFNHWNDKGEIPPDCAACHSKSGFLDYLGADGSEVGKVAKPAPIGSVVDCDTCHNDAIGTLTSVKFPSGKIIEKVESSVQCLVCHQGRESTVSVNKKLEGLEIDAVSTDLAFINIHYRAAAATAYGSEVQGGYEYPDRSYAGRFAHPPPYNSCTGCHDAHSLSLAVDTCTACHETNNPVAIRYDQNDYDGDGDIKESIASEINALRATLGKAIAVYSREFVNAAVAYNPDQYPYYFNDSNEDGSIGDSELSFPNRYQSWTPRLLKAAYNYQFIAKDPGGYAHNPRYVMQLMYDSIESLAEKVETDSALLKRPE